MERWVIFCVPIFPVSPSTWVGSSHVFWPPSRLRLLVSHQRCHIPSSGWNTGSAKKNVGKMVGSAVVIRWFRVTQFSRISKDQNSWISSGKMKQHTAGEPTVAGISKTSSLGIIAHGRLVGNRETPQRRYAAICWPECFVQRSKLSDIMSLMDNAEWRVTQNEPKNMDNNRWSLLWSIESMTIWPWLDPLRCTRRPSRSSIPSSRWPFISWRTTVTSSGAKRSDWRPRPLGIAGNGWEWMGMDGELDVSIDIYFRPRLH